MKNNSNITLDTLIEQITSSVEPSWDALKKIRYVYIELGKYLEKNTDFFMTVMHKVKKEHELKPEEVERIYNDNLEDGSRKDWNRVICRSAAILLSKCLDKLNIENKIIYTTSFDKFETSDDDTFEIRHVFVNAKLGEKRSIFLTLAADLPYIQNNLETQMFGNLIRYKKIDENGNMKQLYEGDEVTDVVEVSKDELLKIDSDLGYTYVLDEDNNHSYVYGNYFIDKIKQGLSGNKLYLDLLAKETDFYNTVYGNVSFKADLNNINEFRKIIYNSCLYISNYIKIFYMVYDYENFNYNEWYSETMNNLNVLKQRGEDVDYFYNIIKVNDSLVNIIGDIATSVLDGSINEENLVKNRNKLNKKLLYLSRLFVNPEYLPSYDDNGLINQNYIAKKLDTMFKYIFSCNEERIDFNELSYNEQIAIIRLIIPVIFNDINDSNCYRQDRSKCMSCIYNIIRSYTYRMLNDGSYELVFEISNNEEPIYYTYNLTSNKFKKITQTKFYFTAINNIICSKDLKDKLNIEKDVESKRTLN